MPPRIYTSPLPPVPNVSTSIFTHLFFSPSHDPSLVGGHPGSAKAFVDGNSGTALTRAQVKNLALSLGYGLRYHPAAAAKRNDVVLVYSHNSLHWPVVVFGAGMDASFQSVVYLLR